jgi:transposase
MPWKESSVTDERVQFMDRRLAGEAMAELCREFGISRKTGYKIFDRYHKDGLSPLGRPRPCGASAIFQPTRRPVQ